MDRIKLGMLLRQDRVRAGLSQRKASKAVGISNSMLSQAERGMEGYALSAESLFKLSELYDMVHYDYLTLAGKMRESVKAVLLRHPERVEDLAVCLLDLEGKND